MRYQPHLLLEGFLFPESPRWHAQRGSFMVSDIDRGEVWEVWLNGARERRYDAGGWISGLAFVDPERLLVVRARERELVMVPLDGAAPAQHFSALESLALWGANDLIRTPSGHCFVGSVNFNFEAAAAGQAEPTPGPLIGVSPAGEASVASAETVFANGMAITPDGSTLLVADSALACVHAFALHPDGSLGSARRFADLPGEMPDGVCLDVTGALWVASHHRVLRVADGGEILDTVEMGETRATACMLGGADGRTLLITASDSHDRRVIHERPSGRLFVVQAPHPGAGLPSIY